MLQNRQCCQTLAKKQYSIECSWTFGRYCQQESKYPSDDSQTLNKECCEALAWKQILTRMLSSTLQMLLNTRKIANTYQNAAKYFFARIVSNILQMLPTLARKQILIGRLQNTRQMLPSAHKKALLTRMLPKTLGRMLPCGGFIT